MRGSNVIFFTQNVGTGCSYVLCLCTGGDVGGSTVPSLGSPRRGLCCSQESSPAAAFTQRGAVCRTQLYCLHLYNQKGFLILLQFGHSMYSVLSNRDTSLIVILCKKLVHKLRLQYQQCLQGNFVGVKGSGR